ncbi:MAG: CYTH domain-containing protein [Planctomycetota bacterium]
MMEREIEVKLLANSVELLTEIEKRTVLAGEPLTSTGERIQEDTYLDTDGFNLLRAGFSLRIRRRNGGAKATLKSVPGRDDRELLRDRTELEAEVPMDSEAPAGTIRDVVLDLIGDVPLRPVVGIRTNRHTFRVGGAESPSAVLCADRAWVIPGEGGEPVGGFLEVEVEDAGGGSELLRRAGHELMDEYGLRPSSLSKFERGLRTLGLLERARGEGRHP